MSNTEFIKVAFLDIDGTVRNKSLMETFVDFLYGLGYISRVVYEGLQSKRVQYKADKDNSDSYEEYVMLVNQTLINAVKGLPLEEVKKLAAQAIAKYRYEDYRYTKRLIEILRTNGYKIIAISGSLEFLVDAFRKFYDFDQSYGHGFSIDEDNVYAATEPITWRDKHLIIHQIIKDNGWEGAQLQSFAVGDTAGDFTMLRSATYPIAINPSKGLVKKMCISATENNKSYYCVVERKDLLYRFVIEPNSTIKDDSVELSDAVLMIDTKRLGIKILDEPNRLKDFKLITD